MKKLFSTSLLILAGMLLLLGSCKEDELPVSGEGNVANNELPVRLAETEQTPIQNRARYRARTLPAVGAILKPEDNGVVQTELV